MEGQWKDILITDRDITLDVAGIPLSVDDRASIAQDIKHMILSSGLLIELVAERSGQKWIENTIKLESLIEEDKRIVPGTVIIVRDINDSGKLWMTAKTILGKVRFTLTVKNVEVIPE